MVVTSSAQTRTVGVASGNWFKYGEINVTWSSNDPNAPKAWYGMNFEEYNETAWVSAEITGVSGKNVTMQYVVHFKNDTDETASSWVNVETGDGNATSMLISANLGVNDTLYTSGPYSIWTINETITRTYVSGPRETNHINLTYGPYNYTIPPDTEVYYYYSMNFYWDKLTGFLVEDNFEIMNQTGEYITEWSLQFRVSESNVWVVPEFPSWIPVLTLFIVLTSAIVVYKRRLVEKPIN